VRRVLLLLLLVFGLVVGACHESFGSFAYRYRVAWWRGFCFVSLRFVVAVYASPRREDGSSGCDK
jgi:hypothetical protein